MDHLFSQILRNTRERLHLPAGWGKIRNVCFCCVLLTFHKPGSGNTSNQSWPIFFLPFIVDSPWGILSLEAFYSCAEIQSVCYLDTDSSQKQSFAGKL